MFVPLADSAQALGKSLHRNPRGGSGQASHDRNRRGGLA